MKNGYFLLLALTLQFSPVHAQLKKKGYLFHSIAGVGWVKGSGANNIVFQTVNGFSKGPWFAGLGMGIDYYRYRTIPVFADIRYQFGREETKLFVYVDGGVNLDWVQPDFSTEPTRWNGYEGNDFRTGFYSDAGIGLNAELKKGKAVVFSLGYSGKTLKERATHNDWRINTDRVTDINTYHFNRLVFKMGFRF